MGQPASVRDRTLARPFPPTHRRMASRSRTTKSSAARGPQGTARPGADPIYRQRGRQGIRESIPHEVACLSYTQEVTGSSPVPPAAIKPLQIARNGCRCERRRMPRWWGLGCIRRAPGFFGSAFGSRSPGSGAAHPVFKTGMAGQPPAWKVRFLRRVVTGNFRPSGLFRPSAGRKGDALPWVNAGQRRPLWWCRRSLSRSPERVRPSAQVPLLIRRQAFDGEASAWHRTRAVGRGPCATPEQTTMVLGETDPMRVLDEGSEQSRPRVRPVASASLPAGATSLEVP